MNKNNVGEFECGIDAYHEFASESETDQKFEIQELESIGEGDSLCQN